MAEVGQNAARQPADAPVRWWHAVAREASRLPDARVSGLPPVIAFLARVGVAPALLLAAMSNRWRQGVSADAALLALPGVDPDDFYRGLARFLGLRFETGPVRFHSSVRWPAANHAGIAATVADNGETRWLVAPRAGNLDALINAHSRGELPRGRLSITSPARFSAMIGRARAQVVRHRASLGLPNKLGSDFSAMAGPSLGQWIAAFIILAYAGFAVIFGGNAWTALCVAGSVVLAGAILLRLFATAASCEPPRRRAPSLPDHQLPVYSIVVPLYREAAMVRRLIAALEALDYPRSKLDIKFVVEADDHETRAALKQLQLPARYEIVVAPAGRPRTKPRALNVALDLARGPLLVVFDAEDQPEPAQLRRAAETFAVAPPRVACLQARLAVDNADDSWLTRLFAVEYAALFDVFDPGLAALGLPMLLGGTSNHFRTRVLRQIGGWDAWNVTEDADLGLRLARKGYDVRVLAETTHEEAPARLGAWFGQRRRWFKGWIQTFVTHSRRPLRLVGEMGILRVCAAFFLLGGGLLGSLSGPILALMIGRDILFGNLLTPRTPLEIAESTCWLFICITGLGSALWPAILGARRRRLPLGLGWLCCLPLRYLLLCCAAWTALFDFFNRPFYWAKTEHGLARTSRRAARREAAEQTLFNPVEAGAET